MCRIVYRYAFSCSSRASDSLKLYGFKQISCFETKIKSFRSERLLFHYMSQIAVKVLVSASVSLLITLSVATLFHWLTAKGAQRLTRAIGIKLKFLPQHLIIAVNDVANFATVLCIAGEVTANCDYGMQPHPFTCCILHSNQREH